MQQYIGLAFTAATVVFGTVSNLLSPSVFGIVACSHND